MRIAFKIFLAYVIKYPSRLILTSLAMIAASCIVLWVISGYNAMMSQFDEIPDKPLGRYDLLLMPGRGGYIPDFVLKKLRKDNAVKTLDTFMQVRVNMVKDSADKDTDVDNGNLFAQKIPLVNGRPPLGPSLVGSSALETQYPLVKGRWLSSDTTAMEGVITESARGRMLSVDVGDYVAVISDAGEFRVKIVGICETPSSITLPAPERGGMGMGGGMMGQGRPGTRRPGGGSPGAAAAGPQSAVGMASRAARPAPGGFPGRGGVPTRALYVNYELAKKVNGLPKGVGFAAIKLAGDAKTGEFIKNWSGRKLEGNRLIDTDMIRAAKASQQMGRMAEGARKQAYSATGLSILAAFFIIITTLSMGVNERIRQFAILRAVAFSRAQVFMVILYESLFLALVGWIGGLLVGWVVIKIGFMGNPGMGMPGAGGSKAAFSNLSILLTGACSFISGTLASLYPAWRASRVNLLDAMQPVKYYSKHRLSAIAVVIGLLLITVNYAVINWFEMTDKTRLMLYGFVGCPAMCFGFLCLTPLVIFISEGCFGRLLAWILGIDPKLMKGLLTGNLWRTLGTTVAMTVGLGLFCAIHIWGASMLVPFFPGEWMPDMLVSFLPAGIRADDVQKYRNIPGVDEDRLIPLAVEQVKLEDDILKSSERHSVVSQDNVVFIGIDPDLAFGGKDPLLEFESQQRNMQKTIEKLKSGRYCIVPDFFLKQSGLKIGDSFKIIPLSGKKEPIAYSIADSVSMPGMHWLTKMTGLRRNTGRTGGMIFTSYDQARKDFGLDRIHFLWANAVSGADFKSIQAAMQKVADTEGDITYNVPGVGEMTTNKQFVNVTSTEALKNSISNRAEGMLWMMIRIPLMILLISSFGVANTIMASVKSRKWEMGIMRSIGTSGVGLAKIVLAESLLIGFSACFLSLAFGVAAGFFGTGITEFSSFFGGMETPLVVPWSVIFQGFGIALGICILSCLWPAISIGRSEVLKLLEDGRGNM